jgi:hypothetical protein
MKFARCLGLIALLSAVTSRPATAGIETVELPEVQAVKALAGIVRDPSGSPITGATVSEVSSDSKTVIRTIATDQNGSFAFPTAPKKRIYHLLISSYGFNPLLIHVRTSRWTKRLLDLKLMVST